VKFYMSPYGSSQSSGQLVKRRTRMDISVLVAKQSISAITHPIIFILSYVIDLLL